MKLLKMLTYFKRKKRIANMIWQRVLKKYPRFPLYDIETGKKRFNDPVTFICTDTTYSAITGKLVKHKKYVKLELSSNDESRKPVYTFDRYGTILWYREYYSYEEFLKEEDILDEIINSND